jgi:hypothetical protein
MAVAALLCLGILWGAYFSYGVARRRRYRRPPGPGFDARVQGRLIGRAGALVGRDGSPLQLKTMVPYHALTLQERWLSRAHEVLLVEQEGRCVPVIVGPEARGARSGTLVTADGLPVTMFRHETLYREPVAEHALLAGRVVLGQWPEPQALCLPVAVGLVWLLGLIFCVTVA